MRFDLVFEDYLVARRRFAWSRARNRYQPKAATLPNLWKTRTKTPDHVAHGDSLRDYYLLVIEKFQALVRIDADGHGLVPTEAADPTDVRRAQRVADARVRNDLLARRCLCSSSNCGRALPHDDIETFMRRELARLATPGAAAYL